jgi:hypothetical protein
MISKYGVISQIVATLIKQTPKIGVKSPFLIDEYSQAKFVGLQLGNLMREIIGF